MSMNCEDSRCSTFTRNRGRRRPLRHRRVAVQRVDHRPAAGGAVQTLAAHGVPDERIDVAWVPGAFEIPTVASRLAASRPLRGRDLPRCGDSRRDDARPAHQSRGEHGPGEIGVQYKLPVLFGILTCNTLEQAIARSGGQAATTGKDDARSPHGQQGRRLCTGRPGDGRPVGKVARGELMRALWIMHDTVK